MPATITSRFSARASMPAKKNESASSTSGPIATLDTSTTASVRRSRSASTISLRKTIHAVRNVDAGDAIGAGAGVMPALPPIRRCEPRTPG